MVMAVHVAVGCVRFSLRNVTTPSSPEEVAATSGVAWRSITCMPCLEVKPYPNTTFFAICVICPSQASIARPVPDATGLLNADTPPFSVSPPIIREPMPCAIEALVVSSLDVNAHLCLLRLLA